MIVRKGRHLRWRNIKKAYKRMGVSTIEALLKILRNHFVEGEKNGYRHHRWENLPERADGSWVGRIRGQDEGREKSESGLWVCDKCGTDEAKKTYQRGYKDGGYAYYFKCTCGNRIKLEKRREDHGR